MGYTLWLLWSNSINRFLQIWATLAIVSNFLPGTSGTNVEPTRLLRTMWQHIGQGLDPTWPPPLWNHCTCWASASVFIPYQALSFWHEHSGFLTHDHTAHSTSEPMLAKMSSSVFLKAPCKMTMLWSHQLIQDIQTQDGSQDNTTNSLDIIYLSTVVKIICILFLPSEHLISEVGWLAW